MGGESPPFLTPGAASPWRSGLGATGHRFWSVPYRRNLGFVDRVALRAEIEGLLPPGEEPAEPRLLVLWGLAGIGKTQLAIDHAHRHADDYDAVIWVQADLPARLAQEYGHLYDALALGGEAKDRTEERVRHVRRWLESPDSGRWLLILDNAEGLEMLRDYLPSRGRGHVLVTSKRPQWSRGVPAREVGKLDRPEARELIRRSGQAEARAVDRLAEVLDDHPLAIVQATGYLADSGMSIGRYLALFENRRDELLRRGVPADQYPLSAFAALDLTMGELKEPAVLELLDVIACLVPGAIPRASLDRAFDDPLRLADAIASLARSSLIRAGADVIEVHGLVQAVAWGRLTPAEQNRITNRAIQLFEPALPRVSRDLGPRVLLNEKAARALAGQFREIPVTEGTLRDVYELSRELLGVQHPKAATLRRRRRINPAILRAVARTSSPGKIAGFYVMYALTARACRELDDGSLPSGIRLRDEHFCASFLRCSGVYISNVVGVDFRTKGWILHLLQDDLSAYRRKNRRLKHVYARPGTVYGLQYMARSGFAEINADSKLRRLDLDQVH